MRRFFEVFQGDIADCGCDVIVNSSNTRLALGPGVSHRISELCGGLAYQDFLRKELAARFPDEESEDESAGRLPLGEAILTGPGECGRFLAILHVAAVDYDARVRKGASAPAGSADEEAIRKGTANLLKALQLFMDQKGVSDLSVGIPLMGTGGGKVGIDAGTASICQGIMTFFPAFSEREGRLSTISKVVIVANREMDARIATNVLRRYKLVRD